MRASGRAERAEPACERLAIGGGRLGGGASLVELASCAVATAGRAAVTVMTTANDSTHISGDRECSTRSPLVTADRLSAG